MIDLRFPWRALPRWLLPGAATHSESALAQRLVAGDAAALEEVYDQYAASLYRVLVGLLGSRVDAEDALQEVFCRPACGKAREIRDLRAYLFTAARNEANSLLRRRMRESLAEGMPEDAFVLAGPSAEQHHLLALLQRLPAEQHEVVTLRVFEQLTFEEIGQLAGISPNTASSRYRYGIERIRKWSEEEDRR
jgi:RNA polymerase sigma-70 factor (ECF subfamily)